MSLRFRVTLLTAALIAFTSTIIGFATYVTVSSVQLEQLDTSLQSALGIEGFLPGNPNRPLKPGDANDFPIPVAIAKVDARGEITWIRPSGSPRNPDPFPAIPANLLAPGADTFVSFVDPETNQSYRTASRNFPRGGSLIALTSLNDYQNSLNLIAWRTLFIVFASSLFGGLIAWFTVRRSFKPVREMVRAAGAIAAGDRHQRMPEGAQGTELGVLSGSMNSMVDSLTLSLQKLEQSESRLRTFVSDASHEIRTPLTVIRGYVELLMLNNESNAGATSEFENRALSRINSESMRLERLVTALLQLDMVRESSTSIENFPLASLVSDSFGDLAQLSNRAVELDLQEISITGSEDGWAQLLANLAQNISRYTPTDAPVAVRLERKDKNDEGWFTLTVDDGGPGIPIGNREMIFDRFTRLDQARDSASGGFGLGMSIIKSVVMAHQGELTLDESPLGGLRVKISAPIRPRQS